MKTINEIKQVAELKINTDTVLFFDMDGTLVNTDFANFLSYKQAIQSVTQIDTDISYNPNERLNRTSLKIIVPNLTEAVYEKIIQQKEEHYKHHLLHTNLNKSVVDILLKYSLSNKTVLVTNCREDRVFMTLNYHNLIDRFSYIFPRQISDNGKRVNKYEYAIKSLKFMTHKIIVLENEKLEIEDALLAGISIDNILSI